MEIGTEYKTIKIIYSEWEEKWEAGLGGREFADSSLKKVKERIDAFLKKENAFSRVKARYMENYRSDEQYEPITITSITEDGEVWIVAAKGERRKISKAGKDNILRDSPDNAERYEQIKKLKIEVAKIKASITTEWASMERHFPPEKE